MGRGLSGLFFLVSGFSLASIPQPSGLGPLQSMESAPKAIAEAAKAVVRIRTVDGGAGTGFFLKQSQELVTNAHVVGYENCTREGCFLDLDLQLERDGEYTTQEVFVVPVLSSQVDDVTVMKVYLPEKSNPLAKPFPAPAGLEFSGVSGETAVDKQVYIVGHPYGGLKRWSAAPVIERSGDWCDTTHCIPSGNSGSPVLNPEGKIVGLVHRTEDFGEKLTDLSHVEHLSMFTLSTSFEKILAGRQTNVESATLKRFISIPLNGIKQITEDDEDAFDITSETIIPLASRKLWNLTMKAEGEDDLEINLLDALLVGCALEIEDPSTSDDPDEHYPMCSMGHQLIECTETPETDGASRCPKGKKRQKWQKLFEDVADFLELKNQSDFVAWRLATVMDFQPTREKAAKAGRDRLLDIAANHEIPAFKLANYLAQLALSKEDMVHKGQDYLQLLTDYKTQKYYAQYFHQIASSIITLTDKKHAFLTPAELEPYYTALLNDPKLPVALKLDLEATAYTEGLAKPISK